MTKRELNKIFSNALETVCEEAIEWYAKEGWSCGYDPYSTFVRIKDKYVLFFDYSPVLIFNDTLHNGLKYSEKEKRYVDNVYAYAKCLEYWMDDKLTSLGKPMADDHHFQCSSCLDCISDDIAITLENHFKIRPIIGDYLIEKEDDGSYFCSCKMNGYIFDTHFKNGSFVETTFEDCFFEYEEDCFENFKEEEILRKHFHHVLFAFDWKMKQELEKLNK